MTVRRFASNSEADRHDAAFWRAIAPDERVLFAWRLSVEQWELFGRKPDEPDFVDLLRAFSEGEVRAIIAA